MTKQGLKNCSHKHIAEFTGGKYCKNCGKTWPPFIVNRYRMPTFKEAVTYQIHHNSEHYDNVTTSDDTVIKQ